MEYIFWEQYPTRQLRYPPLQTYYRAHILENNTCFLTSSVFQLLSYTTSPNNFSLLLFNKGTLFPYWDLLSSNKETFSISY